MKKFLALIMAGAIVSSLVACSSSSGTTETTTAAAEDQSAAAETDSSEAADSSADSGEAVEITYWYQNNKYDDWIQKMAEDFHAENSNITVTPELYGDDAALTSAVSAAFQEQSGPTIFHTRANNDLANYVSAGVIQELSDYGLFDKLNEAGQVASTVEDGMYAVPFGYSAFCVIYNQDIFDELGLEVPTNYDEMLAVVQACKDAGYGGIAYPGSTAGHVWISRAIFRTTMTTDGYNELEKGIDDGSITDLTEYPLAIDALRSMQDYYTQGILYDGSEAMDTNAEFTLFTNEDCAMMVNYTSTMVAEEALSQMNLGCFPLYSQSGDGSYYAEINNMISMNVYASDAEKDAAAEFLSFLLEDDNMAYYATQQAEIVSVDGVVADHKYGELFSTDFSEKGVAMRTINVIPNSSVWNEEMNAMLNSLIFQGGDTDDEVASFNAYLQSADIASLS